MIYLVHYHFPPFFTIEADKLRALETSGNLYHILLLDGEVKYGKLSEQLPLSDLDNEWKTGSRK